MQAIEFVQMQRDDELWELLIDLALSDADMTGASFSTHPFLLKCVHSLLGGSVRNHLTPDPGKGFGVQILLKLSAGVQEPCWTTLGAMWTPCDWCRRFLWGCRSLISGTGLCTS